MKRLLLAGIAVLALGAFSPASAQGVGVQVGPVGAGISFAPEQRTRIKEYVVKEKVRPYVAKERITVGTRIAPEVELHAVPSDWGPSVSRYRYVYSNDRVHFVDPANRTVVYDLD
jgi:hypothetical protein